MNKMKVELVKVKINKLKEVKKQLRKRKCSTKKNLKKLLLENEEKEYEDNILYQSINSLFEEDKDDNEVIHSSTYCDSHTSNLHIDLDDLLESLGDSQNDHSRDNPSESLSINESDIYTEDRTDENINTTVENPYANSFNYVLNTDNNNSEIQGGEINLCDDNEKSFFNSSNMSAQNLKPEMLELGNYYIPDTVFETTNDLTTEMDDLCNEIGISISEGPNKGDTENQIQHSEVDNPAVPDLNKLNDGKTNNHTENEVISNPTNRVVMMVNPLLVSIPGVDLQTMELYQLQQINDSEELSDLEESELLKNYNWEQKASIIAAAKTMYTKRNRTLIRWLDPKLPLGRLKAALELSWQNLPLLQKKVYINQVLGPLSFGNKNIPMLNPQLKSRGFKVSTSPEMPQYERKKISDFSN